MVFPFFVYIFFFNDTATTEIYTLSLHDALPILRAAEGAAARRGRSSPISSARRARATTRLWRTSRRFPSTRDRKSTRLNSSHANISYAVFCFKKKTNYKTAHD